MPGVTIHVNSITKYLHSSISIESLRIRDFHPCTCAAGETGEIGTEVSKRLDEEHALGTTRWSWAVEQRGTTIRWSGNWSRENLRYCGAGPGREF